jgi:ABC-2 type transport system permease protein
MALLVTERAVRDRRRGLVGWAIGIGAYVVLMASFYPAVQSSELQRAIRTYPRELKAFFGGSASFDFTTGAGYLNVELFSLIVPALLAIVAISYGAATLAGEEDAGSLDLLLAYPLTRRRVVLEKVAGLTLTLVALAGVVTASVLLVGAFADLNVGVDRVVSASLGSALVALFVGLLAMLTGAATGSRPVAIGLPTVVFAASYLVVGLAGLVSWMKPLRYVSPLYHATGTLPLRDGLPAANYALLMALCAAAIVGAVVAFDRHDLAR